MSNKVRPAEVRDGPRGTKKDSNYCKRKHRAKVKFARRSNLQRRLRMKK